MTRIGRLLLRRFPRRRELAGEADGRTVVTGWESSGSTFVYQVLDRMGLEVHKTHGKCTDPTRRILFTIRDPRDVICSRSRRYYAEAWEDDRGEEALLSALDDFVASRYLEALEDAVARPNAFVLRYETFFLGHEGVLVRLLADLFGVPLSAPEHAAILRAFSRAANEERAQRFTDFEQYDPDDKIHGRHITSGGRVGTWKSLFTPAVHAEVSRRLGSAAARFGYAMSARGDRSASGNGEA